MQNNTGNVCLPQSGTIAQDFLEKQQAEYGYHQNKIINGFWKHKTKSTCFTLVANGFAVKYVNDEDAEHLINAIKKYYPMKVDKEATKYRYGASLGGPLCDIKNPFFRVKKSMSFYFWCAQSVLKVSHTI